MTAAPPAIHPVIREDLERASALIEPALRQLEGTTVLVTGAAGFLPSYAVDVLAHANRHVLRTPCRIVCVDNYKTGLPDRLQHLGDRDDVEFLRHDIIEPLRFDGDLAYVFHGASIASPTWYRQFPLETLDVNVSGTRHLLELAKERQARGFLYLSSSEIYGDPPPEAVPTSEDYWGNVSSLGPRACYDESKRLGETLCMIYARSFDVPVKIIRPFNVYGPRLRLDDGRVVPDFLADALAGRRIRVFSDGRVTRSFCYVGDAIAAMLSILGSDVAGEAVNVGNDEEVTVRELAEIVDEVSGNRQGVDFATSDEAAYLVDNPQRRCPDLTRLEQITGFRPTVSLRAGIERTFRSYRDHIEG